MKKHTITVKAKQVVEYEQQIEVTEQEHTFLKEALAHGDTVSLKNHTSAYLILQEKIDPISVLSAEEAYTDVSIR